jgi:hypothetical protein
VVTVADPGTPVADDADASSAELLDRAGADYRHQQEITADRTEEGQR